MSFRPNWLSPISVSTRYSTTVASSASAGLEERHGGFTRPVRSQAFDTLAGGPDAVASLRILLSSLAHAKGWMPLAADEAPLLAAVGSSATVLSVDTLWRRFYIGSRAFFLLPDGSSTTALISGNEDGLLTLSAPIGVALPLGTLCYPAFWHAAGVTAAETAISDEVISARISADEEPGPRLLPASAAMSNSLPVFPAIHNWLNELEISYGADSISFNGEKASAVKTKGAKALSSWSLRLISSRSRWWSLLQFFDSVRGRCFPFVFADFTPRWRSSYSSPTVVSINDGSVPAGLQYVVAINTRTLATEKLVVQSSSPSSIVLSSPISSPFQANPAVCFLPGVVCRLREDSLEDSFLTDDVVESSISVQEIPRA